MHWNTSSYATALDSRLVPAAVGPGHALLHGHGDDGSHCAAEQVDVFRAAVVFVVEVRRDRGLGAGLQHLLDQRRTVSRDGLLRAG
jgi:hypothetical protein